jgi:hypothetical protein
MTRGFVNLMKLANRAAKLGREANQRRDRGIAMAFMVDSSNSEICRCEVLYLASAADIASSRQLGWETEERE